MAAGKEEPPEPLHPSTTAVATCAIAQPHQIAVMMAHGLSRGQALTGSVCPRHGRDVARRSAASENVVFMAEVYAGSPEAAILSLVSCQSSP